MLLDRESHRSMLMELINNAHFPGKFAEDVAELKASISGAEIAHTLPSDKQAPSESHTNGHAEVKVAK